MGTSRLPTKCALCGTDPVGGQATTYDGKTLVRLCHDDGPVDTEDGRTCYQKWQVDKLWPVSGEGKTGATMQPLTLDELSVAPTDAAQIIYDLRREVQGLREAMATAEALIDRERFHQDGAWRVLYDARHVTDPRPAERIKKIPSHRSPPTDGAPIWRLTGFPIGSPWLNTQVLKSGTSLTLR